MKTLILDGHSLTLDDLCGLARGAELELSVSDSAQEAVERARRMVVDCVSAGDVVYGLTTGFGKLKNVAIDAADLEQLQRNLILSHCCGVGPDMPRHEVRIAQILRLNGLVIGHSGISSACVETLVRLFNKGFVPVVPQKGSVGASGDLAPLAHMASTYMGYGRAWVGDRELPASEALEACAEEPLVLQAKEGLALINGTEIMKATGIAVYHRALELSKAADVLAALTLEALLGSAKPFDPRLAELKHNDGHRRTAANVRACLADSDVLKSHAGCGRVQDPYSLRCVPQVHGAFKTALTHVAEVLAGEINSVTDNPLLFPETGEIISAGQFHGQPLSLIMDYLGMALTTLANIAERRIEQLVNPDLSNLPAFLTREPGLNSGLMMAQVSAAALASENKILAHPASADSIPTNGNQEDHVSMGVTAARKAREICDNLESILAIEYLCAAQARDFHRELSAGRGAEAAQATLRGRVPVLERDRYLKDDIEIARELLSSGALVAAVEAATGPLEG